MIELLRGHLLRGTTLSFPRVRGNQKGASPVCGGTRRGHPPRVGELEGAGAAPAPLTPRRFDQSRFFAAYE